MNLEALKDLETKSMRLRGDAERATMTADLMEPKP